MKFNTIIPERAVENLKKSLEFYVQDAGFRIEYQRENEKFAFLSRDGAQIMLETPSQVKTPRQGIHFQVLVNDVDALFDKMQKKKARVSGIGEKQHATKKGTVTLRQFWAEDPDGYKIRFAQQLQKTALRCGQTP